MGLKQMVEKAMQDTQESKPARPPVHVSGDAVKAYTEKVREWSGWSDATVVFKKPDSVSPFASVNKISHTFTVNPEALLLNPNRVLLTVTPFRMRQEAVLTGCLLHEVGHARHSNWLPSSKEEAEARPLQHSDGTEPTEQTIALARVAEEARIEGIIAHEEGVIGAAGLGWTMRAAAAHLLPLSSIDDLPRDQQIMTLVQSWLLRAGRQYALRSVKGNPMEWAIRFRYLLREEAEKHLSEMRERQLERDGKSTIDPHEDVDLVIRTLLAMVDDPLGDSDSGSFMIDSAREVLTRLFPETDSDSMPMLAPSGCSSVSDESDTEDGEDDAAEGDAEDDDAEDDAAEGDAEGEGSPDDDSDVPAEGSDLAAILRELEEEANEDTQEEQGEQVANPTLPSMTATAGGGGTGSHGSNWRAPDKDERMIQKNAERFLRGLIDPSEASKTALADTPSATVDGASLAAWKAGGQVRSPHFFKRTRREVVESPPVKIAVLVDISFSMGSLQKPSSVLSWALASAALDLRNFAGRGQQIESTLIHWGDRAHVVQRPGEKVPGINTVPCNDGTQAMAQAMALVEEQIPGFFDTPADGKPSNRLLVQFTDWELSTNGYKESAAAVRRALKSGVNMISVVPKSYNAYGRSALPGITTGLVGQRGISSVLKYDTLFPEQVWEHAAEALR